MWGLLVKAVGFVAPGLVAAFSFDKVKDYFTGAAEEAAESAGSEAAGGFLATVWGFVKGIFGIGDKESPQARVAPTTEGGNTPSTLAEGRDSSTPRNRPLGRRPLFADERPSTQEASGGGITVSTTNDEAVPVRVMPTGGFRTSLSKNMLDASNQELYTKDDGSIGLRNDTTNLNVDGFSHGIGAGAKAADDRMRLELMEMKAQRSGNQSEAMRNYYLPVDAAERIDPDDERTWTEAFGFEAGGGAPSLTERDANALLSVNMPGGRNQAFADVFHNQAVMDNFVGVKTAELAELEKIDLSKLSEDERKAVEGVIEATKQDLAEITYRVPQEVADSYRDMVGKMDGITDASTGVPYYNRAPADIEAKAQMALLSRSFEYTDAEGNSQEYKEYELKDGKLYNAQTGERVVNSYEEVMTLLKENQDNPSHWQDVTARVLARLIDDEDAKGLDAAIVAFDEQTQNRDEVHTYNEMRMGRAEKRLELVDNALNGEGMDKLRAHYLASVVSDGKFSALADRADEVGDEARSIAGDRASYQNGKEADFKTHSDAAGRG